MFNLLSIINPHIAAVILSNPFLTGYVSLINSHYNVACVLPSVDALEAEERCNGGGDFQSCWYTFSLDCSEVGAAGPQKLEVVAEYFPLGNFILNLDLAIQYRR